MPDETTRRRLVSLLREGEHTASELGDALDVPPPVVYAHLRHVAQSLSESDEELLVAPPECRECGFDGFDDPANDPSRCPECKSERIDEPVFTVR